MRKNFPLDMLKGKLHTTNSCGVISVVEYVSTVNVIVEFTDTKYITKATSGQIRRGAVKDNLKPSVFGVGYIGDGAYSVRVGGVLSPRYITWKGMIERCYSEKLHVKHPTYINCEVCKEWHDYQCFSAWYDENYPVDGKRYALDKDIKIDGNKLYSPDTCLFVTAEENAIKANAIGFRIINPSGELIEVYNLNKFCRDNELHPSCVSKLINGKQMEHKGWKPWLL